MSIGNKIMNFLDLFFFWCATGKVKNRSRLKDNLCNWLINNYPIYGQNKKGNSLELWRSFVRGWTGAPEALVFVPGLRRKLQTDSVLTPAPHLSPICHSSWVWLCPGVITCWMEMLPICVEATLSLPCICIGLPCPSCGFHCGWADVTQSSRSDQF